MVQRPISKHEKNYLSLKEMKDIRSEGVQHKTQPMRTVSHYIPKVNFTG